MAYITGNMSNQFACSQNFQIGNTFNSSRCVVTGSVVQKRKSSIDYPPRKVRRNNRKRNISVFVISAGGYFNGADIFKVVSNISDFDKHASPLTYTKKIEIPDNYPSISEKTKYKADEICNGIYKIRHIQPTRVAASIEGGIAIVYTKNRGILKKNHEEIFIEVYNDLDVVMSYSKNYNLIKVFEVKDDNKAIITNFIKEIL